MSWIKATDVMPPEDEQILLHDAANERIEVGRYVGVRWYVEDVRDGRLRGIEGVTHWAWILDSQLNDDSDDD
jgi:hypothetical protein